MGNLAIEWLLYSICSLMGIDPSSRLGESIYFFVYDSIKVIILLFLMILVMGFIRTYIPQERMKRWLSNKGKFAGVAAASFFGAITPFCSCSSIPIFMGFLEAGIPLSVAFSFLITSPLVNEYLVVLMLSFFGWRITVLYVLFGMLIGIVSGIILGSMSLEKHLVKDLITKRASAREMKHKGIKTRLSFGYKEAKSILRKMWVWVVVGVGIGALIHNYIPEDILQAIISSVGPFSVPIAVILGVPMYGSCAAIVPIAVALFQKGIPLGTALSFMMAIAGLSFPEAIILRRVMKLKLILLFFGIVALGIILIGYLFNALQYLIV